MSKKHQKAAAARARANRHKLKTSTPPPETISEPLAETFVDSFDDLAAVAIDVDWEYDCGYEGGVNREDSDTEYQPGSSSDDSQWDAESLDELSGDELESNLQQQRELLAEVAALTVPTPYSQIMVPKTKDQWARAEQNRALGYTGSSMRSKRRNAQDARDREEFRKKARTS